MPRTPNREQGEMLLPEGLVLEVTVGSPSSNGGVRFDGTDFLMRDAAGVFNPRTGTVSTDYAWRRTFLLMGA